MDPSYLRERSALIRPEKSMGRAAPGKPAGAPLSLGADATQEAAGTSHLSVIDARGNAVTMTTTVESAFGSRILVRGFLLNNQLTDFSFAPEENGRPAANRVEAGKRPRSSMAPTFVFAPDAGTVSFEGTRINPPGLKEYLLVHGRARVTEGGAPELLQRLAHVYLGPDVKFPPMPDPPPGFISHISVDRIGGNGPWSSG